MGKRTTPAPIAGKRPYGCHDSHSTRQNSASDAKRKRQFDYLVEKNLYTEFLASKYGTIDAFLKSRGIFI